MKILRVVSDTPCELGEGVFYECESKLLYWVDIRHNQLFIFDNLQVATYRTPETMSAVVGVKDGNVILLGRSGVWEFSIEETAWRVGCKTPEYYRKDDFRSNDGLMLGDGVFLYGVMKNTPVDGSGALILCNKGDCRVVHRGIAIPNTFIHVPNSNKVLVSDSLSRVVYMLTFSTDYTRVLSRAIWLDFSHTKYTPDGGFLIKDKVYLSVWGGSKILKLDLMAKVKNEYALPVPYPTNCILSDKENTLFVTSAYEGMQATQRELYPLSGHTLEVAL